MNKNKKPSFGRTKGGLRVSWFERGHGPPQRPSPTNALQPSGGLLNKRRQFTS